MKKFLTLVLAFALILSVSSVAMAAEAWEGSTIDTSWYDADPSGTSFSITTAAQLAGLAKIVNDGTTDFSGDTVTLGDDIDLNNKAWTPIGPSGDSSNKFKGTFDGNGKTISNLYVKQGAAYHAAGLFGAVNGTVKNLTIDGASVESLSSGSATVNGTAVLAGSTAYGADILNVTVKNATVKGNRYVAGIVGYMDGTVKNCTVEDITIIATPDNLGGSYDNGDKVGGIVGYTNSGATEISGNTLKGNVDITAYRDVGGVVGMIQNGVTVNGNTNEATVSITIDQTTNSYGAKTANAGEFCGRNAPADVEENNNRAAGGSYAAQEYAVATIGTVRYATLQAAINAAVNGDIITLLDDCAEDVTVEQKADVKFTIDGAGKKMTGIITVNGKSARYPTAGLTIQNFKFDATRVEGIDPDYACINLGKKGDSNTRYTSNVTVMDCTFTDSGSTNRDTAAIKSYTGGDVNLKVIRCNVDDKMHSLLQLAGVEGVVIDDCTVNSKNGINLNSSKDVEIKNSTISVSGYAVRAGVDDSSTGVESGSSGKITLTNNTFKTSADPSKDAAIILRDSAARYVDLTMTKNVVSAAMHISGVDADKNTKSKISADGNYWDGLNSPIVDGEKVPVKNYYTDEELTNLVESSDAPLQVSPSELDFGSVEYGYDPIPAKEMTIINNSDNAITLADVESDHYDIDPAIGGKVIEAGKSLTVKVSPKTGLDVSSYNVKITVSIADTSTTPGTVSTRATTAQPSCDANLKFTVTAKKSSSSGISVKYNGGNSFSTSNPSVPTGVEIDGVPVTFNGTGSNFSVGCISSDAKWVTVRWNSTSVTTNFTPDGLVECTTVSIPKTGDMSIWAAIAQFLGF